MVLVYSQNANSSGEIQKELALAAQNQLTVIPIRIDDVVPTKGFGYSLATSQWVEIFPDIENNLDRIGTTIKNITKRVEEFTSEVRQAIEEDDGVIGPTEQKILEELGVERGFTVVKAQTIIRNVVGGASRSNIQERELKYLHIITEVLEDGRISGIEKSQLARKSVSLGISNSRAQALLDQEMAKRGLSSDTTISAVPFPHDTDHGLNVAAEPKVANKFRSDLPSSVSDLSRTPSPTARSQESNFKGVPSSSNEPDVAADDEMPDEILNWDYHALGALKVREVLAHPEVVFLIQGISIFANKTEQTIRKYLRNADQEQLVMDAVKDYRELLDPSYLASMNVAMARDLKLEKVIAEVLGMENIGDVSQILGATHGKTLLRKAFVDYWPD